MLDYQLFKQMFCFACLLLANFAPCSCATLLVFLHQVTAAKCRLARDQTPTDPAVDGMKFIQTGVRNVFSLVKKFSSSSNVSDLSHSEQEKSPLPGAKAPDKFTFDSMGLDYRPKHQNRTPDHTQSFTDRGAAPTCGVVQRGESMRDTTSSNNCGTHKEIAADGDGDGKPGRVVLRRRKPVVNHNVPDDELAAILNRRSHYLENYEAEIASSSDGCSSAEKSVNNFELQLAQRKCRAPQPDDDDLELRVCHVKEPENGDKLGNGHALAKDASRMTKMSSAEHVHESSVMSPKHCTTKPGPSIHCVAKKPIQTSAKDISNGQVKPVYRSHSEDGVNCSAEKNVAPPVRQLHSQEKSFDSHMNTALKKSTAQPVDPSVSSVLKTESRLSENKSKLSTEAMITPQHLAGQSSSKESNGPLNMKQKLSTNPPTTSTREKPLHLVQQSIPSVHKKKPEVSNDRFSPSNDTPHEPNASTTTITRSFRLRKTCSMECDIPSSNQKPRRRQLKRSKTIASSTIDPELAEALSRRREKSGEKQEEDGKAAGDNRSVTGVLSRVSVYDQYMGNSTVTRVTFLSSCDTEFNILFTILLLSNPSCVCC